MTINRQLVLSISLLASAAAGCYALAISAEPTTPSAETTAGSIAAAPSVAKADPDLTSVSSAASDSVLFHLDPLDVHLSLIHI